MGVIGKNSTRLLNRVNYIIEDSSFVVSLLDTSDVLHQSAVDVFRLIISHSSNIRVIIPSTVFYETLFVLLKNGVSYGQAKTKLNNLMMVDEVINFAITETNILKLARYTQQLIQNKTNKTKVRSNDLLIASIACNQENSCLITSDVGMKDYDPIYKNIFLFNTPNGINSLKAFLTNQG